jgi:hypothetical protein
LRGRGLALPFIDGHQCSNDRCALCCEFGWGIRFKSMTVMAVTKFERFFCVVAGLHVDKQDLRRYSDFVNQKIYDLLLRGQAAAKANGRDVIEPHDLPITKGLQESIQAFSALDKDIELKAILDHITARPPLHLAIGAETESKLADIAGGLSVALSHTFKSIDPTIQNPATEHWERAFQIFNLLL